MADDTDVITLDSDDEDTNNSSLPSLNGGVTIKRIPGVTRTMNPGGPAPRLPLPPALQNSSQMLQQRKQVPRKPGVFPPFALFSQEHRAEVVASQENMGFGDVGRKLGEMWHALSEEQKEDYRRRAREISDQKMAEYQESLRKMPPQQRQVAINQANAPQKKRRTHGYAIFSAEMRKNLGAAMNPQETANVIAESWRSASPSVRRDYEERAARVNAAQLRRIAPQPQQQQVRPVQRVQYAQPNGTGLRIANVSSLSPQTKRPPAQVGPKLPSGISISRVEPDLQILSEQIQPPPQRMPPQRLTPQQAIRGRPPTRKPNLSPAAQAAMRVKAQLRAQHSPGAFNNGHQPQWPPQPAPRGRGMVGRPRGRGMPQFGTMNMGSVLKRPAPNLGGMGMNANAKVPRMMRPVQMTTKIEQRLCRCCGLISPVGCKLAERPEILQTLIELTMTSVDLVKDQMEGYPGEVCKRCMVSINNFSAFKRTFEQGQSRLKSHAERLRPNLPNLPLVHPSEFASVDIVTPSTSSEGVDNIAEESILPDLDCEVDFGENPANVPNIPQPVDIREEKVRVITPSQEKIRIKTEVSQPMDSDNIVDNPNQEKVGEREHKEEEKSKAEEDDNKDEDDKKDIEKCVEKKDDTDEKLSQEGDANAESFDPLTCTEENENDNDTDGIGESDVKSNQEPNETSTEAENSQDESQDQQNTDITTADEQLLAEDDDFNTNEDDSLLNGNDTNMSQNGVDAGNADELSNNINNEDTTDGSSVAVDPIFGNSEETSKDGNEDDFENQPAEDNSDNDVIDPIMANSEETSKDGNDDTIVNQPSEDITDDNTDNDASNMEVDPIMANLEEESKDDEAVIENQISDDITDDNDASNTAVDPIMANSEEVSKDGSPYDNDEIEHPSAEDITEGDNDEIEHPSAEDITEGTNTENDTNFTNNDGDSEHPNTNNVTNFNDGSQDANDAFVPQNSNETEKNDD